MIGAVASISPANADTCVPATHSVTYDCGDGSAGSLPAPATVTYGASFTPTLLTGAHCTAPDGYKQAGIEIWADGEDIGGYATKASAFNYYYASDMIIRPHYVPQDYSAISTATLWEARGLGGIRCNIDSTNMTWQAEFSYGVVSGVATCSPQKPQNTAQGGYTGYIADDQESIVAKDKTGRYCYCKMTEPYFADSPWVLAHDYGDASVCAPACVRNCDLVRYNTVFRASIFRGARPNRQ